MEGPCGLSLNLQTSFQGCSPHPFFYSMLDSRLSLAITSEHSALGLRLGQAGVRGITMLCKRLAPDSSFQPGF